MRREKRPILQYLRCGRALGPGRGVEDRGLWHVLSPLPGALTAGQLPGTSPPPQAGPHLCTLPFILFLGASGAWLENTFKTQFESASQFRQLPDAFQRYFKSAQDQCKLGCRDGNPGASGGARGQTGQSGDRRDAGGPVSAPPAGADGPAGGTTTLQLEEKPEVGCLYEIPCYFLNPVLAKQRPSKGLSQRQPRAGAQRRAVCSEAVGAGGGGRTSEAETAGVLLCQLGVTARPPNTRDSAGPQDEAGGGREDEVPQVGPLLGQARPEMM